MRRVKFELYKKPWFDLLKQQICIYLFKLGSFEFHALNLRNLSYDTVFFQVKLILLSFQVLMSPRFYSLQFFYITNLFKLPVWYNSVFLPVDIFKEVTLLF